MRSLITQDLPSQKNSTQNVHEWPNSEVSWRNIMYIVIVSYSETETATMHICG